MSVNWNKVKRKMNLRRRNIVDVHLPRLVDTGAAEATIDREADAQRRSRLVSEATSGLDRHQVRELYRETFGHP